MSTNQPNLPGFLQELAQGSASKVSSDDVVFINMRNFKNHGNFFMIPFNGANGEEPIRNIAGVIEIRIPRSGISKDGKPYSYSERRYVFSDPSVYGDLTESQERRLDQLKSKINAIRDLGYKDVATRTYTLLQGFLIEHKDKDGKILNQNTPAVMAFSSVAVTKSINEAFKNMNEKTGNYAWLMELVNNNITDRNRFLSMSVSFTQGQGGYSSSCSVEKVDSDVHRLTGGKDVFDLTPYKDKLEKLGDPIKTFINMPPDLSLFDETYISETEAIVNSILRTISSGETVGADPIANNGTDSSTEDKIDKAAEGKSTEGATETKDATADKPELDDLPF